MIIRFYDEQPPITIDDNRGELLRAEVNRETPKYITIDGHGTFAKASIKSMIPSAPKGTKALPAKLPPSSIDLTEEERTHKIKKIREMKRKFMEGRK